jgi:hypothetical protein
MYRLTDLSWDRNKEADVAIYATITDCVQNAAMRSKKKKKERKKRKRKRRRHCSQ